MKNNTVLPNNHFNKSNKKYKMAFSQAAQKKRRSSLRKQKATEIFPRPAKKLLPIVSCQSQRYNHKQKYGKGFSLKEIEMAGISEIKARKLRIHIDKKRKTKSEENLNLNVQRIKEYLNRIVFFKNTKEVSENKINQFNGILMPKN